MDLEHLNSLEKLDSVDFIFVYTGQISQRAVGIDFGTMYSSIAVWKNGACEKIPGQNGHDVFPTTVSVEGNQIIFDRDYWEADSLYTLKRFKLKKFFFFYY